MFPLKVKELGFFLNQEKFSERMISGVCIDSRNLKPGDLFFALPGARLDGHAFLREAASKGAGGAVVSCNYLGEDFGLELFTVEDVLGTLHELTRLSITMHHPKIIGITGSLGKTTTKDFTTALLRSSFTVSSSAGNENGQLGLPLTVLNRKGKEDILVLEMGMTEKGHLSKLVQLAPPSIAVVTSVALVHACNFENLAGIAEAKAEIFSHPDTKVGIYNALMPHSSVIHQTGACKKISFACEDPSADYSLKYENGQMTIFHFGRQVMEATWGLQGHHNVQNCLAAMTVAHQCGMGWEEIKQSLAKLTLPAMRLQHVERKGIHFINDAYNANQDSMCAALRSLPDPGPGKRRIAVLGDMRELGRFSEECHKEVGKFALDHIDRLFCLGEGCKPIVNCWNKANRPVDLFSTRAELVARLRSEVEQGDVVLLKGSRAHALWLVLEEF